MLKYVTTEIVFQEIPDEVTLAVNIAGCPCRCPGCHSPHLWRDEGQPLDEEALCRLVEQYGNDITTVALMGGDAAPAEVDRLVCALRKRFPHIRTAWWSGRARLSPQICLGNFDYIKLGPYLAHLGPLKSPTTNQRLYRVSDNTLHDITSRFWRGK